MPKQKMKTKKALAKRVKVTKNGNLKVGHAFRSHRAQGKSTKQKRHLKKATLMHKSDQIRVKQLIQG